MANDPICGMIVDEQHAKNNDTFIIKNNKEYYFCSSNCKEQFVNQKWYQSESFAKIFPWILGITLIAGATWSFLGNFMTTYMGIFFIVFSTSKMLDWRGFVKAFSRYDLIAKNITLYAWTYPAIEFILGILYLTEILYSNQTIILVASLITLFVMGIGALGVTRNLLSKNQVKCACLGTKINVPLTKVTLMEDVIMSFMAIAIIF